MKSLWRKYQQLAVHQRFLELTERERVLAFLAAVVLILFGGFTLFVEPVSDAIAKAEAKTARQQSEIRRYDTQIAVFEEELARDPNDSLKQQSARLLARVQEVDNQFANEIQDLVPAQQMPGLLETVLSGASDLTLLEMKSIPPLDVLADGTPQQESGQNEVGLYQHGVKLVLEGSYFDVQRYIASLENLSWRFYWKSFDYQVQQYPTAKVQIELYTLSTSKAFIGV